MLIETQYFPPILFWAKAYKNKVITIEKFENYQKRSYRNKCRILAANKVLTLSIPLSKGKNSGTRITDVEVSNVESWRENHLQSIRSAYGSSPYFEFYWDDIKSLVSSVDNNLYTYNLNILKYFARIFKYEIKETEEYLRESKFDFRQKIIPKLQTAKFPEYLQVFGEKHPFQQNLSILDLLFCLGPESILYIKKISLLEDT